MNNNPDVPPVALCAFRNESDSGERVLRTHRFGWVKMSGKGNKWSLSCILSPPSHTLNWVCVGAARMPRKIKPLL